MLNSGGVSSPSSRPEPVPSREPADWSGKPMVWPLKTWLPGKCENENVTDHSTNYYKVWQNITNYRIKLWLNYDKDGHFVSCYPTPMASQWPSALHKPCRFRVAESCKAQSFHFSVLLDFCFGFSSDLIVFIWHKDEGVLYRYDVI